MSGLTEKHSEIKELIKKHSPFDKKETDRILNKFFNSIPANVELLIKKYQFDKKKVLDIGCSYGQTLFYWSKDSEGVEIDSRKRQLPRALGYTVHELDVEEGFPNLKEESYDVIYTNNLIEHLECPHLFLIRLYSLLKPEGILVIGHPTVPPLPFRSLWKLLGYRGWLAKEHINFFTPQTAKLTLERAGFEIKNQHFAGVERIHPILSKIFIPIGVRLLSICQKIESFKYPSKRLSEFDPSCASEHKYFR